MPGGKFFKTRPPVKDRVRRFMRSESFIETSRGLYSIRHNGRKIVLEADARFEPLINSIELRIRTAEEKKLVGVFAASPEGMGTWKLYHREVPEENREFRGYNIGRLGFNLIEQAIRKADGEKIIMGVEQKDVLNTALGLKYEVSVESLNRLKALLGIGWEKPLPDKKKIREILRSKKVEYDWEGKIFVIKYLKPLMKP